MVAELRSTSVRERLWSSTTFGMMLPNEFPYRVAPGEEIIAAARRADELGVDALWVGDHVMSHTPVLDCMSVLAMLAGATTYPVLASGVLIAPLRHPVLLAKAAMTIDHLSGGRFTLGLGVGGEIPQEFAACDADLTRRGRRTDSMIEVLHELLAGASASSSSGAWSFTDVRLEPPAPQRGGPPIVVGGRSTAALRRAGRLAEGWLGYFVTAERFRKSWHEIESNATKAGRDPTSLLPAVLVFCSVDDDASLAGRRGDEWLVAQFHAPLEKIQRYCLAGTPAQVAEQLTAFLDAGARHVVLASAGTDPMDQVSALAEGVMPLLGSYTS